MRSWIMSFGPVCSKSKLCLDYALQSIDFSSWIMVVLDMMTLGLHFVVFAVKRIRTVIFECYETVSFNVKIFPSILVDNEICWLLILLTSCMFLYHHSWPNLHWLSGLLRVASAWQETRANLNKQQHFVLLKKLFPCKMYTFLFFHSCSV